VLRSDDQPFAHRGEQARSSTEPARPLTPRLGAMEEEDADVPGNVPPVDVLPRCPLVALQDRACAQRRA